ncbi:MAG: hypothetical protein WA080_03890 [Sulfuricurvum sp.]|jgi:hypothetical protein
MCRFSQLSDAEKILLRDQLIRYANTVGGKNAFLRIVETIRHTSPHPLLSKTSLLRFPKGAIQWNKSIHRDNFALLSTQIKGRTEENQNLMVDEKHKLFKSITNMLRALGTLTIRVTLNGTEEGEGFTLKAFDIPDETTTLLNPFFEILFFCPITIIKKILSFTKKETAE